MSERTIIVPGAELIVAETRVEHPGCHAFPDGDADAPGAILIARAPAKPLTRKLRVKAKLPRKRAA